MKYIKTFEINSEIISDINIGDYVIITCHWLEDVSQIIDIIYDVKTRYRIKTFRKITKNQRDTNTKQDRSEITLSISKKSIKRKATEEEILQHNMKNDITKYNL